MLNFKTDLSQISLVSEDCDNVLSSIKYQEQERIEIQLFAPYFYVVQTVSSPTKFKLLTI